MSSTKAPRKPQGALDWNEKQVQKVLDKQGYVLGFPKIDGVRLILRVTPDGEGQLRSRSGKNFPALKDFEAALNANGNLYSLGQSADVPVEYEAELTVTNESGEDLPCEETSGMLQRLEQVRPGKLRLRFFDNAVDGSEAKNYSVRLLRLELLRPLLRSAVGRTGAEGRVLAGEELTTLEAINQHYEWYRAHGYEGGIYRDPSCPVRAGKVLGMWKRKPHETQDGIITGIVQAVDEQGNKKGMVGSLIVQYEDGTTGRAGAGALTHAERLIYWNKPGRIIGRYCEVKMMEETGKGGKRHPNFLMFRDTVDNKGVKV